MPTRVSSFNNEKDRSCHPAVSITVTDRSDGKLKERVKLELVGDRQADKAVGVILRHTLSDPHEPDGHVTLLDVSEVLQITHPASDFGKAGER